MGQAAEDLRSQLATQRAEISRDLDAIGDRVSPSRMMERRQAAVRQRFGDVRERVMGSADTATHRMRDGMSTGVADVQDTMSGAAQSTRHAYEGNPLAMGMVALGAGMVAATLFPASRTERRLAAQAQPTLEQAAEQAGPRVREMAGEMKQEITPAARDAVTEVKDLAKEGVANVKAEASSAAADTRDEAEHQRQIMRET